MLALMVVLSHLASVKIGRVAVMAFFILSGYWVTRMFEQKYSGEGFPIRFYISRFLRIWPFFSFTFLFFYLVFFFSPHPNDTEFLFGLTLFGVASDHLDVLGTSWSLDIEMQFYLLLPILAQIASWCLVRQYRWPFLGILLAITAIGWAVDFYFHLVLLPMYVLPFMLGMMIWKTRYRPSGSMALASAAGFVLFGVVLTTIPQTHFLVVNPHEWEWWYDSFAFVWAFLLFPFIAWNVWQRSSTIDKHLGNLSFPLYLVHFPIKVLLVEALDSESLSTKLLICAVSLGFAILTYLLVDRPIEGWRTRYATRPVAEKSRAAKSAIGLL